MRSERRNTFPARRGEHLEVVYTVPLESFDPECLDFGGCDQATLDVLDLVRTVLVQTRPAAFVDSEANSAPPAKSALGAWHLGYVDATFDAGESPKLFGNEIRLEVALCREPDVLPVTAATTTRACVGTWRLDSVWRRLNDLDGVGA
jgi:hypothetical protein